MIIQFVDGAQIRYKINAALRQEVMTRLTPSLDKPVQPFFSFTDPADNKTIIISTSKILSIEIVRL